MTIKKHIGTVTEVTQTDEEYNIKFRTAEGRDFSFHLNKADALNQQFLRAAAGRNVEMETCDMLVTSLKIEGKHFVDTYRRL